MQRTLSDLRNHTQQLAHALALVQADQEPDEQYRSFLGEQIQILHDAMHTAATPETYRVAVVGSFKVGKSSFVNALCNVTRLVSVATNPETAAVTTLHYNERPRASIHMIKDSAWEAMRKAYIADSSDPAALRYATMLKKEKDGELMLAAQEGKEKTCISIAELEQKYLSSEGVVEQVTCDNWGDPKAQREFSKSLALFTSQASPTHFFVDQLNVYVPVPFLREGIELIDTPGLNDTDRFRVRITEQEVENVDVILFLMRSGSSYSQHDKEFITTQLRKGTLKSLVLVVTRCDQTYAEACTNAEEIEDAPPTFTEHLTKEEQRLRGQIRATLDELLNTPQLSDELREFYLRQLLDIRVYFTSVNYYSEARKTKDSAVAQRMVAQSGIEQLRTDLAVMLAQSERIVRAKETLTKAIETVLDRITRTFTARRDSVAHADNVARVRDQLTQIDAKLTAQLANFAQTLQGQVQLFRQQNQADDMLTQTQIALAISQAREVVIRDFEMTDIARHWKTRRNNGWGTLGDIQEKVANRIFPQVEQPLRVYASRFGQLLTQTRADLARLETILSAIDATSGLAKKQSLGLTTVFDQSYQAKLQELEDLVKQQRTGIASHLDNFISEEIEAQIDTARENVASEWGRGTTQRQNQHISDFYALLNRELQKALETYLRTALKDFAQTLEANAQLIYPHLKRNLHQAIEDHRKAIESNLVERNEQQKEALLGYLRGVLREVEALRGRYI